MLEEPEMREKYAALTKKQRYIFDYMQSHPGDVCYISLRGLADQLGVSEVSILRLCRALGFDGFQALKEAFRAFQPAGDRLRIRRVEAVPADMQDCVSDAIHRVRNNVMDTLNGLDMENIYSCVKLIRQADEIFTFAHDASKLLADSLTIRFHYMRLKAMSVNLGDNDTVQSVLARMTPRKLAVFFSFPVFHMPTAEVVRFARLKGAGVIAITNSLQSPAVVEDSHNLLCRTDTPFFYNTQSTPLALIEILTTCIAQDMGEEMKRIRLDEKLVGEYLRQEQG